MGGRVVSVLCWCLGLGLLGGCGSSSGGWVKPGMTEQQLGQDTASCLTEARAIVPSREGPRTTVDQDRYRRCMTDRGYSASEQK